MLKQGCHYLHTYRQNSPNSLHQTQSDSHSRVISSKRCVIRLRTVAVIRGTPVKRCWLSVDMLRTCWHFICAVTVLAHNLIICVGCLVVILTLLSRAQEAERMCVCGGGGGIVPPVDFAILTFPLWTLRGKNGTKSRRCSPLSGSIPPLLLQRQVPRLFWRISLINSTQTFSII